MITFRLKRGLFDNLPTSSMSAGEPMATTDRGTLHLATGESTKLPVVPAIDALTALGTIDSANDLLLLHDASESSGQMEKKISFADFKTALAIPEGSSDEKAAIVSGGAAGYIWGTDGTDGLIRLDSSLSWTKDASNGFVTIKVETIDGGTF